MRKNVKRLLAAFLVCILLLATFGRDSLDRVFASEGEESQELTEAAEALSFTGSANGVSVEASAEAGTFPEGTEMQVTAVQDASVADVVNETVEGTVAGIKAVDISFYYEGEEIQPAEGKSVSVKLTAEGLGEAENEIVHIDDDGNAEIIADAEITDGSAAFDADHFSIYIVVEKDDTADDEQNAVATYEFYHEGTPVLTQYIKDGESLTDPGSYGADEANTVFKGWFDEAGNEISFGSPISVPETKTVKVNSKVLKTYYVTFWGEKDAEGNRGIVAVKSVTVEGSASGTVTTSDISVTPKADTSAFKGWATEDAGTDPVGASVEVSGRMDLYAIVVHANWLHFFGNDGGANESSYTAPVFVAETDALASKKPADPVRKGYVFSGWYTDEACTTAFDWTGTGLEADTDLYAKWEPADATYTVIIWKQKVTDKKDAADSEKTYDYETSDELTAKTGDELDAKDFEKYTKYSYTGFHYREGSIEIKPDTTVEANGSTVVNVYYDRNLLTIHFVDGSTLEYVETTDNTGTQYGLIGDEYVPLTRRGNTWTYDKENIFNGTTYSLATGNTGTQYGFVNGQMTEITYHRGLIGGYWTVGPDGARYYGNRYVTPAAGYSGYGVVGGEVVSIYQNDDLNWVYTTPETYSGTRYKLQNVPASFDYTGLYGSTLESNGYEWPSDRAWFERPNGGGTRLTFLDAFLFGGLSGTSENETVLTQYGQNLSGQNTIRFYKQQLNGSYPATPTNSVNSTSGGTFTITEKYNGFKAVQYSNGNGIWTNTSSGRSVSSTNLQIRFERNQYDLTFVSDGEIVAETKVLYEDKLSNHKIADPTKEHYVFAGWCEDNAGQKLINFDTETMPAANKVVYAKWEPEEYTVTLDTNGGKLIGALEGVTELKFTYGEEPDSVNKELLYMDSEREGYELVGWFENGTDAYGFGKVEKDTKLVAKWRFPGLVKIVYQNQAGQDYGSDLPVDNYSYATDSSVVLGAPPKTVKDGYMFIGWKVGGKRYYVNNTFDITEDLIDDYKTETQTGTVNVYAIYQDLSKGAYETTTITYNANGGTGADIVVKDLRINEPVTAKTIDDAGFTYPGYEFKEWNTDKDGKGLSISGGEEIAADLLTLANNTDENTLYAIWEKVEPQTHAINVKLEYYKGDTLEEAKASEPAKTEDFDKSGPFLEELELEVTVDEDAFEGYTYDAEATEGELKYTLEAGKATPEDVNVVKVYFINDESSKVHAIKVIVEYYKGDTLEEAKASEPAKTEDFDKSGPFLEELELKVTVDENAFEGYTLDTIDGDIIYKLEAKEETSEDYTVKAYFVKDEEEEPETVKITYILNGGNLDGDEGPVVVEVPVGTEITLPKPVREGYTFDYWEGSKYNAGDKYVANEDHTFTAQWVKDEDEEVPPDKKDEDKVPDTGDHHHTNLWIALLAVSLMGLASILVYDKKRQQA